MNKIKICQYCNEKEATKKIKFDSSINEFALMCEECANNFKELQEVKG